MTFLKSVLFGILGVVLGAYAVSLTPSAASASGKGPYILMQHSNVTANAGVFRLDTASGGVSYCYVSNNTELMCSKEAF